MESGTNSEGKYQEILQGLELSQSEPRSGKQSVDAAQEKPCSDLESPSEESPPVENVGTGDHSYSKIFNVDEMIKH